ncbi:MAG: tRNA preQ1(34) S-adenosylmethionine ribosyltransferase-isomerase QueA [Myxococcales bacterium]|nr:tRNA preQ1(34) S-adenosylmethionine ribosyltransferase-isomerase QueA [Myxococcales bacterium]
MTPKRPPFEAERLDYELPATSIAQEPLARRDASRLLCTPLGRFEPRDLRIDALPGLLPPSLLIFNDTRVIPARLLGHKPSGGRVELLLLERISQSGPSERWLALGRASKGLRPGASLQLAEGQIEARVLEAGPEPGVLQVQLSSVDGGPLAEAIEREGHVPLPPYIKRTDGAADRERYQTVFAAHDGAVAAPTAGLHFTEALLERLRAAGHLTATVTLHVGPGTFAPLRAEDLREHAMHSERYFIPEATADAIAAAREEGRTVVAVGTTVVRTLEAAAAEPAGLAAGQGRTSLLIYPPYRFRVVEAMLTNFHLPRSTLLALVMAFGGEEPVRRAYRHAVEQGYRFYSYGDAMLLGGSR